MKRIDNVYIRTEALVHHPNNPRKNLGDLTELEKSIEKNGILQNLTVIPKDKDGNDIDYDHATNFWVLIGNRRFEAGKKILEEFPANIIEGLSEREQLSIMLEENMQRNDLTIIEQAEGFQMMLDLGETVEGIVEKTGFSESTVYHRLNIAKLDKKTLKQRYNDNEFQLNITDLYELERIKEQKERNKILKEARSSREIKRLVDESLKRTRQKEVSGKIIALLEEYGIQKMPDKMANSYSYFNNYDQLRQYDIPGCKIPVKIHGLPKSTKDKPVYYKVSTSYGGGIYAVTVYAKKDKIEKKKSDYEIRFDNIKKKEKEITDKLKGLKATLRQIIASIISGKMNMVEDIDKNEYLEELWDTLVDNAGYINRDEMVYSWTTKSRYEMEEDQKAVFIDTWNSGCPSVYDQMLITIINGCFSNGIITYDHKPSERNCEKYLSVIDFLKRAYDYYIPDEYEQLLNGKDKLWKELEEISK